ncbi:MAG TPA: response regulator [Anaeromyxobacter sp.]|nr:response regulator [Anaeromyxobacter sp.]
MPRRQDMNATTTRRPKALLLDGDPSLRLLATELLARGYEVRAARDAASGLELLLDELLDLDVLVVDRELPGRDGASLVRLVRDAGGERDLAIVVLADRPARAERAQLLALGADAVVDRVDGPRAAADVVVATRRRGERGWLGSAGPAVRGALLVARDAFAPRGLEPSPA